MNESEHLTDQSTENIRRFYRERLGVMDQSTNVGKLVNTARTILGSETELKWTTWAVEAFLGNDFHEIERFSTQDEAESCKRTLLRGHPELTIAIIENTRKVIPARPDTKTGKGQER